MDKWMRECAAFHGSQKVYLFGRGSGRVAASVAMSKTFPKMKTVVYDLHTLDILVRAGLKPSQIIVTSEFNNTSRFDMTQGSVYWGDQS